MVHLYVGALATGLLLAFCTGSLVSNAFLVMVHHRPVFGTLLLFLFLVFFAMLCISYVGSFFRDCGALPSCTNATNVEQYTRAELEKYAAREAPEDVAEESKEPKEGSSCLEDSMNANQLAQQRFAERLEVEEPEIRDDAPQSLLASATNSVTEGPAADDPAATEERRKRKERRGLQVLTVPQLAKNMISAMDQGGEAKRRELSRLFGSVELCSFCQVYMLQGTYHCRFCERCVPFMSHHCCSIGQCVGYGNHKFYILLIFYIILCGILSLITSLVVLLNNWNFFVSIQHSNFTFYWGFNGTLSITLLLCFYLPKHLHTVGCGESFIRGLKREHQEMLMQRRRDTRNGVFSGVLQEEIIPKKTFDWKNFTRVFGVETNRIRYVLPTEVPSHYNFKENMQDELRELIAVQLQSLADVTYDEPLPE